MNDMKSRRLSYCFSLLLVWVTPALSAPGSAVGGAEVQAAAQSVTSGALKPISQGAIPLAAQPAQVTTNQNVTAEESTLLSKNVASDVRVIIDISGSMKQNDPENLRVPALNLIVEMLPEGSQAGVWTFGQWVNMLIAPDEVDQQWRDNAKDKAQQINSHGLRTNIGEAMEKATWKLAKDSGYGQSVILLTDGFVDIAGEKDPQKKEKDEKERQRILSDVLRRYKETGTKIHTIALSDNADKILLDRLSLETGGMAEVVRNSEELIKAFVKTFDQAAPEVAEQVPLSKDNTFNIDNSVQEFTALIFRKAGTPAAQLKNPSGNVISQIKAIPNARWFGESVYDLVTVEQPEPGEWQILADLDPDNRVTVVSDLKMEIENLPTNLFPGQQIDFEVYLHEDGEIITRKEFLELMTVEMKMTAESGRSGTKVISDPANIPADGRYKESIKRLSKEGEYELKIRVDGKTFQRMRKTYLQVRQPIGFEIRKRMVNGQAAYAVRVVPQSPDMQVAETRVIAKLKGPDQHSIIQSIPWVEEGVWETLVTADKGPGTYQVKMNIKGKLGQNQEFRVKPDPLSLTFPIPEGFTHEYFVKDEATEIAQVPAEPLMEAPPAPPVPPENTEALDMPDLSEKMAEQEQEQEVQDEPKAPEAVSETAEEAEEKLEEEESSSGLPSWLMILIPILTVFAGLGGFLGYRAMEKKKAKQALAQSSAAETPTATKDVSLNDGLDNEDFDEDFDLSDDDDDDDDEEISLDTESNDDLESLDLGDDDDFDLDDVSSDDSDMQSEPATGQSGGDDIPDFDEDFDLGGDAPPSLDEEGAAEAQVATDTATEGDDLDADVASEDVVIPEEDIPSLEPSDDLEDILDTAIGGDEDDAIAEEDIPTIEPDEADNEQPEDQQEASEIDESQKDNNIDADLANLENELDDIDLDGLMDDEESDDK